MGVHDINFSLHICDALGFEQPGVTHELGQDAVCVGRGVCTIEVVRSNHRSPWRRCRSEHLELRRFIPRIGFCTPDQGRISARHRGFSDCQTSQVVSHGDEGCASGIVKL